MDIHIQSEGSIILFHPLTQAAVDWIAENVQGDAQWFGTALVVEHRYARDLAAGMMEAGLACS
jgi:hypothetical protein